MTRSEARRASSTRTAWTPARGKALAAWLVPVTALRRTPGARRHEQRQGRIGGLRVVASAVPPGAPAEADVVLTAIDGGIEVAGEVRAAWEGECRRCLRPVGGELLAEVRELYRPLEPQHGPEHRHRHRRPSDRVSPVATRATRPAPSGDDDEEDTYRFEGEQLDLQPLIRDALLLALPLAPLCQPDCAGLCPTCGADRNDGPCGCAPASTDPRWAALDQLRLNSSGPSGE